MLLHLFMARELDIDVDDDADTTVIQLGQGSAVTEPPALPMSLSRRKAATDVDEAWVRALPNEVRAVLEAARKPARAWPFAPRIQGAVARPARKQASS